MHTFWDDCSYDSGNIDLQTGCCEKLTFGCLAYARIRPEILSQKQGLANHLEEPTDS